jgi:hypothetical protein
MAVTRKVWPNLRDPDEVVSVPLADQMDDDTLLNHIEARHAAECKVETFISRHNVSAWISTYRVFHDRLHKIAVPGQYDHVHEDWTEEDDE